MKIKKREKKNTREEAKKKREEAKKKRKEDEKRLEKAKELFKECKQLGNIKLPKISMDTKVINFSQDDHLTIENLLEFCAAKWLSSDTINAYAAVLNQQQEHTRALSTYVFSSIRNLCIIEKQRKQQQQQQQNNNLIINSIISDIKGKYDQAQAIIVPINIKNAHWLMAVIKPHVSTIEIFNSMKSCYKENTITYLRRLLDFLFNNTIQDESAWRVIIKASSQQQNGSDCGVFICQYAKLFAIKQEKKIENIRVNNQTRVAMIYELIKRTLLPPETIETHGANYQLPTAETETREEIAPPPNICFKCKKIFPTHQEALRHEISCKAPPPDDHYRPPYYIPPQ